MVDKTIVVDRDQTNFPAGYERTKELVRFLPEQSLISDVGMDPKVWKAVTTAIEAANDSDPLVAKSPEFHALVSYTLEADGEDVTEGSIPQDKLAEWFEHTVDFIRWLVY